MWRIVLVAHSAVKDFMGGFATEEEAERAAAAMDWCYVDENRFEWDLEVRPEDDNTMAMNGIRPEDMLSEDVLF